MQVVAHHLVVNVVDVVDVVVHNGSSEPTAAAWNNLAVSPAAAAASPVATAVTSAEAAITTITTTIAIAADPLSIGLTVSISFTVGISIDLSESVATFGHIVSIHGLLFHHGLVKHRLTSISPEVEDHVLDQQAQFILLLTGKGSKFLSDLGSFELEANVGRQKEVVLGLGSWLANRLCSFLLSHR